MQRYYKAPWSNALAIVSILVTVICIGGGIAVAVGTEGWLTWTALVPLLIVAGAALFTVRGYTITANAILVHRLCWDTLLPLTGLRSARIRPGAMRRSLRLWGNGGLYSFSGFFRNKNLGVYRAFVTDPVQTVVLSFANRTVVVSPKPAEDFVRELANSGYSAS